MKFNSEKLLFSRKLILTFNLSLEIQHQKQVNLLVWTGSSIEHYTEGPVFKSWREQKFRENLILPDPTVYDAQKVGPKSMKFSVPKVQYTIESRMLGKNPQSC